MSSRQEILARFSGQRGGRPILYLPDLTLWYEWHAREQTLPDQWKGLSLPQVARALDVPIWLTARPWRVETPGVDVETIDNEGERVMRAVTSAGTLISRWTFGPDGDWWQTEYPVKSAQDLEAVLALVEARRFVLDTSDLARLEAEVGEDGVLALELPRRPYSDLLHDFLGWSEGLLLLREPPVDEILSVLEAKLQRLVQEVAALPGPVVLSPDNLDGQFISPRAFDAHLADSYRQTTEVLQRHAKYLVVHVGGPMRHLLALLAQAGVDGVEGVAGPPQGDVSLAEAREIGGPQLALWGGIPQDFLVGAHDKERLEAAVAQAVRDAVGDGRMILGVADRVPVDADLGRLETLPSLIQETFSDA